MVLFLSVSLLVGNHCVKSQLCRLTGLFLVRTVEDHFQGNDQISNLAMLFKIGHFMALYTCIHLFVVLLKFRGANCFFFSWCYCFYCVLDFLIFFLFVLFIFVVLVDFFVSFGGLQRGIFQLKL